jgi:hypothetical protein
MAHSCNQGRQQGAFGISRARYNLTRNARLTRGDVGVCDLLLSTAITAIGPLGEVTNGLPLLPSPACLHAHHAASVFLSHTPLNCLYLKKRDAHRPRWIDLRPRNSREEVRACRRPACCCCCCCSAGPTDCSRFRSLRRDDSFASQNKRKKLSDVIRTLAIITLVTIMFCYVVTSFFDWTSA